MELFNLFLGSALVANVILANFLGICSFVGVSKKSESALGMGMAVVFVITAASIVTWPVYNLILIPNELSFMRTIVFILVIATLVQFVEMFMKKQMPTLYKSLGVYLPLITVNCAVLGAALLNIDRGLNFIGATVNGFGIAAGYCLVIYLFSTIRERLESARTPEGFKGVPIALVTAAIMAMAFIGFFGLGG